MNETQRKVLQMLVRILNDNHIEFQISGGFAAIAYGSPRSLYDIDVEIYAKDKDKIANLFKEYITEDWNNDLEGEEDQFDLWVIKLNIDDVLVDISLVEDFRIKSKDGEWVNQPGHLECTIKEIDGIKIPIQNKEALIKYKRLVRRDVDLEDIKYMQSTRSNLAFIDGQNLNLGTKEEGWKIDLKKFRIYLQEKYAVKDAYYFLGYISDLQSDLYSNLQRCGYIVVFKEHNSSALGQKKGNVDSDIIFEIMKNLVEGNDFDKIVLVSGDGDYKKVVDYLIKKDKFEKILFPNKKFASSLYKKLTVKYFDYLSQPDIRKKIEYIGKTKMEKRA